MSLAVNFRLVNMTTGEYKYLEDGSFRGSGFTFVRDLIDSMDKYSQYIPITDEVFEHLQGDFILADSPVLHGTHRLDMLRRPSQHLHGVLADLDDAVGVGINGDDGRLIEHDALPLHIDEHGRRSEINGDVPGHIV